jgi:transcriptional regulator with XRE-family HTH domain
MYRQRIAEEKKRLNLSARTMSDLSRLHILEETISRFLSGKTADPGINTVLDLAETVGLKPYEIFMDSTLVAEFRAFLELKSKSAETEAERVRMLAENEDLKTTNAGLVDKIRVLEMQLAHKEELVKVYEHLTKINTKE